MDYVNIIKRGWSHTWNNKFLWALGFLAALGGGASGGSSYRWTSGSGDMSGMESWMTPGNMAALTGALIALLCVGFIAGIIFWLVSLSASGGLIGGVAQLELGTGKPTFGSAFRLGWNKVWRLAGMTIVLYIVPTILIIVLVAFFVVAVGGLAAAGQSLDSTALTAGIGGLGLVFMCLLCLMVPVIFALSLIYPFAYRGIVLRDMGIRESLRHGWATLKTNLGEIIILGLAFFLIGLVVGFVILAVLAPLALIVGVPFVALMRSDATVLQGILAALGILVAIVITALISSVTTAWQSSTFTLAYLEWTGKNVAVE